MDIDKAREFLRGHHRAVLATYRRDGRAQLSPVAVAVDDEGRVVISTRETAMKTLNVRRDPRVTMCVVSDQWHGEWVYVDGQASVLCLPDALEPLVDYYRRVAGEHPDWDDYRAAMVRDKRVLLRVAIERAGPDLRG